jgi:molecular chaperone DnaK
LLSKRDLKLDERSLEVQLKDILEALIGNPMKQPSEPFRVIGIDLGTTNSTVCEIVWDPNREKPETPHCLNVDQMTTQGRYTHVLVPSVVALHGGETWVGEGAKRLRAVQGAGLEENKSWFAETKNDMGVRRTYHRAPAEFRSARAVAAEILKFLNEAALAESDIPIARTVVTVPASFQAAQRRDTVDAAQRAGISLADGELLDEPIAAFLDYLIECAKDDDQFLPKEGATKNLVVFDFGGGTCDVAVLRLGRSANGRLTVTPLNVSRYHRLGGGDIDRAIIHEVLLPQLIEQNGLDLHALGFEEKRQRVQPALLAVAEALKQKLSIEFVRLQKFGRWQGIDRATGVQTQPGAYPIELKDRTLTLQSPKLSALEFEKVLAPFFDRDLLMPREDEYRVSCSIFAPLEDALTRGRLDQDDIDICLLAGGSTLIPQVAEAVGDYFTNARILAFPGRDDTQTAIAKGAAMHALSLALAEKSIIQPICHDDICFQTSRGPVVLVPRGTELPYPIGGGFEKRDDFKVPQTVKAGAEGEIRIQVLAGDEHRPLFEEVWVIKGPVKKGAPLLLEFQFSENQVLELHMRMPGLENKFEGMIENPLTHVVNPNADRSKIEDLEEALRSGKVGTDEMPVAFEELAELYRKLRQNEKALTFYRRAIQLRTDPSAHLLNRMAFCARDLGDRERADRFFGEADRVAPWSGTLFNWALAKEQWGMPEEALALVEKAIGLEDDPPYSVLRARLVQKTGDGAKGIRLADEALKCFGPLSGQDEFELHWFRIATRITGDDALLRDADAMARKRVRRADDRSSSSGEFPDLERMPDEDEE